jgi:hypothetical protein
MFNVCELACAVLVPSTGVVVTGTAVGASEGTPAAVPLSTGASGSGEGEGDPTSGVDVALASAEATDDTLPWPAA